MKRPRAPHRWQPAPVVLLFAAVVVGPTWLVAGVARAEPLPEPADGPRAEGAPPAAEGDDGPRSDEASTVGEAQTRDAAAARASDEEQIAGGADAPTGERTGREEAEQDAPVPAADAELPAIPPDDPDPAKAYFRRGVALSRQARFAASAQAFEESLAIADRPATRYNLVRVYAELEQPLQVAEHALAFLALPREPHRAEARAEVESHFAKATRALAVLAVSRSPADAALTVDGAPVPLRDEAGRAYLRPGTHVIEVTAPGYLPYRDERLLPSGQVTTVAVTLAAKPGPPEVVVETARSPWRRRLAIGFGALGAASWLAGLGTYAGAEVLQPEVARTDPEAPGSLELADRYHRVHTVSEVSSFGGGLLMLGGALLSERVPERRWGWLALGLGTALAGAGVVMAAAMPADGDDRVGEWRLHSPTVLLAHSFIGAALPAIGFGIRWLWMKREAQVALTPTGLRGRF